MRCSALRWPMTGSTADLRRNWRLIRGVTPRFWPEMKPELVIGRRVAAAVSLVGEDTPEGAADHCLHVRDHGCQGVTVIGIATLSSGVSRNSQSPLRRRRRTGACALHPVCRRACLHGASSCTARSFPDPRAIDQAPVRIRRIPSNGLFRSRTRFR